MSPDVFAIGLFVTGVLAIWIVWATDGRGGGGWPRGPAAKGGGA